MTPKPTPDFKQFARQVRDDSRSITVRHFRCNECGSKIVLSCSVDGCREVSAANKTDDESLVELRDSVLDMQKEIGSILVELDNLARVWGDEGVFRRCRDRLRKVLVGR